MDPGPINTKEELRKLVEEYIVDENPRGLIEIGQWNVSRVTDMSKLFKGFYRGDSETEGDKFRTFNQPLNDWDVSNVTNMEGMFAYAR
jgi:hypothetical protein